MKKSRVVGFCASMTFQWSHFNHFISKIQCFLYDTICSQASCFVMLWNIFVPYNLAQRDSVRFVKFTPHQDCVWFVHTPGFFSITIKLISNLCLTAKSLKMWLYRHATYQSGKLLLKWNLWAKGNIAQINRSSDLTDG